VGPGPDDDDGAGGRGVTAQRVCVGVVPSRFPKLSETFILDELVALERHGVEVVPMPLHLQHPHHRHPDADRFVRISRADPLWSRAVLTHQLHWLRHHPRAYLEAWAGALRGTVRSPGFFARALLVVPLAARIAVDAERARATHLHAHYATHPALACWVASRLTGLPWSMTVHAHDITVDTTMLAEKARDAAFVVAISERNAQIVRAAGGPGTVVHVIHCGVDLTRLTPRPAAARSPRDPFVVTCVASLEPYKGHEHLLRAVALLAGSGVDVRLQLVGAGDRERALRGLTRSLAVEDRVRFLGPLDRDAVAGVLLGSHAFALASIVTRAGKTEGIPVALMEAMALELPVVATRVGSVDELVRDGQDGLLVPPADPVALADALRRLAERPALAAQLGQAGRRTVAQGFDRARETARLAGLLAGEGAGVDVDRAPSALGDERRERAVDVQRPAVRSA
jgi:colanic acid/amylovoran biosynthesis glycosyltransferase